MAEQCERVRNSIPETSIFLKVAWFLGTAPLVVGVLIFLLWILLRASILELAGIYTICGGIVCVVLAAICLAIHLWRSWGSKKVPGTRLTRQVAALSGLFLANFVIAGGLLYGAIAIETCYCVSVTNDSPLPLQSARIYGGGVDILLGDIAPGSTVRKFLWVTQDGTLMFEATCGTDTVSATVVGYVTGGMGGNMAVTVDASNQVTVREKPGGLLSQ
jgi:hypothetical protein